MKSVMNGFYLSIDFADEIVTFSKTEHYFGIFDPNIRLQLNNAALIRGRQIDVTQSYSVFVA